MKSFWQFLVLLFVWILHSVKAQSSYYRHEYYNPIASSPTRYYRRSSAFAPVAYTRDLISEETKHKSSSKKYSKPTPNRNAYPLEEEDFSNERYASGEFSNESRGFNSQEQDSREYTIGTHIHVQHPITVPKKITSSHPKTIKTSSKSHPFTKDVGFSGEVFGPDSPTSLPLKKQHPSKYSQHYEPDPFHIIPPPKTTSPGIVASSSVGYNVYETEPEDYQPPKKVRDRYKNVASAKQIEAFLEDQQKKLLDEALKIQLLNNPDFKQFLKEKEKKRLQKEQHRQYYSEDDGIISPPNPPPSVFLDTLEDGITFTTPRPRRRPADFKRSPKRNPNIGKPKRKFRSAIVIDS